MTNDCITSTVVSYLSVSESLEISSLCFELDFFARLLLLLPRSSSFCRSTYMFFLKQDNTATSFRSLNNRLTVKHQNLNTEKPGGRSPCAWAKLLMRTFTLRLDVAKLCPFVGNAELPVFLIKNVDAIIIQNNRRIYSQLYSWNYSNEPTWAHMCAFQPNYEHRKHAVCRKRRWLVYTQLWINSAHNLSLMSRLLL